MLSTMWPKYLNTAVSTIYFVAVVNQGRAVNLALNKPAFQSSTIMQAISSVAGNAVDGNSNSNWSSGSCTHTDPGQGDTDRWWMVDLQQDYAITAVTIVKRQDEFAHFLRDFVVETFWSNPMMFPGAKGSICQRYDGIFPPTETLHCNQPLIGRFVRIRMAPPTTIMVCEVSVMGTDATVEGCPWLRRSFQRLTGKRLIATSATMHSSSCRADCVRACWEEKACQATNFNELTKSCDLVRDVLETDVMTPDPNWDLYYM